MQNIIIGLMALVVALSGYVAGVKDAPAPVLGSVTQGNEYNSTSTKNFVGTSLSDKTLKVGVGSLAQVTITGAAAGVVTLCDATTTSVSLRAKATSTLTCWNIPASAAAGTYVFDAQFVDGLIIDTESTAPTSTVMWR